ncbi:MAG: pyridoxal phosphate-dependent aminotransferase [Planctomycetes bacterium]|nr:pyridoxal phosphate-dependent aminotransferase [Planctomycetota bacterium]
MKLSSRVEALAESATLAVTAKAAQLKSEGVDVVSFGAGEPDFDTPQHIKLAAIRAIEAGQTKYSKPATGIAAVKQAVCEKLARENELQYKPSQVIVTAGGKMACNLAIQALIDPGDEVIIPVPYWVSYPEMVKLAGGVPVFLEGDENDSFKFSPAALEAAITPKTRLLIFNSPSNPGGFTYHPAETQAIAEVTARHDMVVLADEIYDRLRFDGQAFQSFASSSSKAYEQTLTLIGASKTYSMTGWRAGYVAGPVPIIKAMAKLQSQSTSGACTFVQHGLIEALTGDQSEVERMRVEFEKRGAHIHQRLNALPGISCNKPTGAFYVFPNVSGTYSKLSVAGSIEFAKAVLEKAHVAVVPGIAFGSDACVRFSFACSMEQIDKGLDRLAEFLR